MKKKIYKILSLLLVLAVLVTTCAHGNWFAADAADASNYVTSTVTPKLEQGTIYNYGEVAMVQRLRTSGYYSTADFESVTISSGYKVSYHFYTLTDNNNNKTYTWKGVSNTWSDGTTNVATILSNAVDNTGKKLSSTSDIYFFRIILAAFESGKEKQDSINPDTFTGLQLTLKSHNTELSQPAISQGTLDTGAVMTNVPQRAHTQYLLPIEDYESVSLNSGYKALCHFYDAEGRWIKKYPDNWESGDGGEIFDLTETSTPSNAKYFKICFASTGNVTMDENQITSAGLVITPVNTTPDYSTYYNNNGGQGLKNTIAKMNNGEKIDVVYMGGSITVGANSTDSSEKSWRALTTAKLNELANELNSTTKSEINTVHSAYAETGTLFGAYRVGPEILDDDSITPDLVFIEFAINDQIDKNNRNNYNKNNSNAARPVIDETASKMQLESIIQAIRTKYIDCDIVIVLTTDNSGASNPGLHTYAQYHKTIAEHYNIPTVELELALEAKLASGTKWADYFDSDLTHPNNAGHQFYADVVNAYLTSEKESYEANSEIQVHALKSPLSKTLIDYTKIEFIDVSQELLTASTELGGKGFTFNPTANNGLWKDTQARPNNIFKGLIGSKKVDNSVLNVDDVFVLQFTGVELYLLEYQAVDGIKVSVDSEPENWDNVTAIKRDSVVPLALATNLENKEHTVYIKPVYKSTETTQSFHIEGFFVVKGDEEDNSQEYFTNFEPGKLGLNTATNKDGAELDDSTTCTKREDEYICTHEYIRMVEKLPIADYQGIKVSNEYQMWVYVYDAKGNYMGATSGWVNTAYSTTTMIDQFTQIKYDEDGNEISRTEPTHFQAYFRKNPDVATTTTIEHEDIFLIDEGDIAILAKEVVETGKNLTLNVPTNEYPTIEAAVDYALSKGYGKNDTVTLNVTSHIPWVADNAADNQITSYAFKLVIEGSGTVYASTNSGSKNKNIHMGGDVEIKGVTLEGALWDMLFFKNHDVTIANDVNFNYTTNGTTRSIISFGNYKSEDNKSNVYRNTIQAEIKAQVKEIYLSNYNGPSMVYGDMHVHYDNANGNPIFYLGPRDENSSTVYNAGIDMIIDAASSITFKNTNNVRFGLGGYLQVLNNASAPTKSNPNAVVAIDNQVALDNASSVWIVNNELPEGEKDNIQFTGYKGIYTVKGNKKVYVYKGDQQVAESRNGQINLAVLGAGIYTLKYEGEYSVVTYVPKPNGQEEGTTTDTIAGLIEQAIANQPTDSQELYKQVYIDLSNIKYIDFGTWSNKDSDNYISSHNFEVIVWSDDNDVVVNIPSGTQLKGSMTFDSVKLDCASDNGTLKLDGHDFTVTETCKIIDFANIYSGSNSDKEYEPRKNSEGTVLDGDQVITIDAAYSGTIELGSNSETYNKDLYLVINNLASSPTVNANATKYSQDLNINVKRAGTVNITTGSQITQLIRQEKATVKLNGTTLNGTTDGATYYIVDKSFNTGCIDCTETPGIYTSNTEFIITATHTDKTVITSVDDVLTLKVNDAFKTGKWDLTTTDYFEDFKGVTSLEEFKKLGWNTNGVGEIYTPKDSDIGQYRSKLTFQQEKLHLTSANYLLENLNGKPVITNDNISSRTQYISIDFQGSGILDSKFRSTSLTDKNTDNIRDHGAGVALYARLDLAKSQGYELKVAKNRIILTKRASDRKNGGHLGSNADYKVVLYSGNKHIETYDTVESYNNRYKELQTAANATNATAEQKQEFDKFKNYEKRYLMASCDFEVAHLTSYMHYNRFPESYDEGNAININEDHIYRLGMSVVDGDKDGTAYVRILLLDVTTNRLVVDETFKDLDAKNFGGDKFGFGLYGGPEKTDGSKDDRFCEADFDKVWFSTERFRGGDMGELNDINYDSYFDVRDLVRVYEYMGGANARINFNAADRDYNGYITTFDESEVRKELLHGAGDSFRLVGQREDAADELRNDIVNMGTTGEGSGIVEKNGEKWYYPDLSQKNSSESYLKGIEVKGSVYYVSTTAKEPENVKFTVSEKSKDYWLESGEIDRFGRYKESTTRVRTKYFLELDENFKISTSSNIQIQCFLYDEDFNYLGKTVSKAAGSGGSETVMDRAYLENSKNLELEAKQVSDRCLPYKPVYVKFQIYNSSGITVDKAIDKIGVSSSYTISGYDYYKDKADENGNPSGSKENPWTFRQFQLYGDSQELIGSENLGTDTAPNWVAVRHDPLTVLKAGDAVLFERSNNDVKFENIKQMQVVSLDGQIPASYTAFFGQSGVLYGAYGTGEKPIINASAKNYASADANGNSLWTKVKDNIYCCDVSDITQYDNNRDNAVLNVIFNKGAKIGTRKFFAKDLHTLYKEGQYATEIIKDADGNVTGGKLYLYCEDKAPDKKYNQIYMTRCLYGGYINIRAENIVFDNINFLGFGGGGIRGAFNCPNNTTQNCEISYSGGMIHPAEKITENDYNKKYGLRYGNGIETWENSNNFVIDHNWIYHTFDSAVSPQGDGSSTGNYIGFKITNNLFEYNNCDVEYFDDANESGDKKTEHGEVLETILKDVVIADNIFRFTAFGWGTRESDKIRGIQGVLRMDLRKDEYIDIDFYNNLIDTPGMEIFTIKNYNLASNTSKDFASPFYKFGSIFNQSKYNESATEYGLEPNGTTSKLYGNSYYYNYYLRNYPYVSTGYLVDSDTTYNESNANRKADSDDQLAQNLAKIDSTGTFYWYSTPVKP